MLKKMTEETKNDDVQDTNLDNMVERIYGAEKVVRVDETDVADLEKVKWFGMVCSFIIPLVGFFLFYIRRNTRSNPQVYLYSAILGYLLTSLKGAIEMLLEID